MCKTIMIGCDLHDRSMLVRFAVGDSEPQQKSFANDAPGRTRMIQVFKQLAQEHQSSRIVFVYEASGQGYGLSDQLHDAGIECHVLSPALLPTTVRSKKPRTDAKDAQMLLEQVRTRGVFVLNAGSHRRWRSALSVLRTINHWLRGFVLAGNPLPVVWTAPQRLRDDRELVRCRVDSADNLTAIKLQILSMLKRRGIEKPRWLRSNSWSKAWVAWLRETAAAMDDFVGPVLESYAARFELYRDELTCLDREIRRLARTPRYKVPHDELRKIRGVGLLTAMTFLTEMGDLTRSHWLSVSGCRPCPGSVPNGMTAAQQTRRACENRRQIGAYLGLCPASFESGEKSNRKGRITRQGPPRLRRMLCQAVWSALRTDPEITQAWNRLHRGKADRRKKAVVALMRQLGIRMWHRALACGVSIELIGRGPGGHRTSAQAQQRGTVPSVPPSCQPLASTG